MYLCRNIDGRAMAGFFPHRLPHDRPAPALRLRQRHRPDGAHLPAHEFHHAVAQPLAEVPCAFRVVKAGAPDRVWSCGYERENTLAGFPHLHFASHPELIGRLWP
jgi:cobyrinic acid a,c-diamide synthase